MSKLCEIRAQVARGIRAGALCLVVASAAAPAQQDLVTLSARNEELASLLEALSVQHRLNLVAGDHVQGRVTINLYDVPLERALAQILGTQGLTFVVEDGCYRVLTAEAQRAREAAADVIETRVFGLSHITADEASQLLQPLVSPDGQLTRLEPTTGGLAAAGAGQAAGASGPEGSGQRETIVVRDRQSRLAEIAAALAVLDQPPQQVLLEATILSIDLGEDNRLGVDFNVLGGTGFVELGAASDLTRVGGYQIPTDSLDSFSFSGQTFGFTNDPPTQGLSLGFVSDNVAGFVEALEDTTNATIVSNPKVVALNGQMARIIVGGRLGYTTLLTTETSTIEQVQFLNTGTQLMFRAFVGEDGWIRLEVHPRNSAGVVDPVSGVPSESTTEISSSILIRDGQTLVLGGLISESISTVRSQIPFLGSLPVLGALFGRTQETVSRRELVILMTPHVLDPAVARRQAEEAQERFDAVRRSHWQALSPYLRPVMAQRCFEDAEVLSLRGDAKGALGAVERALTLHPTLVPAARLRQRLVEDLALESLRDDEERAMVVLQKLASPAGEHPENGPAEADPPAEEHR
ncbi:MAG: hypothetical protein AAF628_21255 [Planctomycetota bacterium]